MRYLELIKKAIDYSDMTQFGYSVLIGPYKIHRVDTDTDSLYVHDEYSFINYMLVEWFNRENIDVIIDNRELLGNAFHTELETAIVLRKELTEALQTLYKEGVR